VVELVFSKGQPLEQDIVDRYRVDADTLQHPMAMKEPGGMLPVSSEAEIVLAGDPSPRL
jgi:hypothetical protein